MGRARLDELGRATTEGFSGAPGTKIVYIDCQHFVYVEVFAIFSAVLRNMR